MVALKRTLLLLQPLVELDFSWNEREGHLEVVVPLIPGGEALQLTIN